MEIINITVEPDIVETVNITVFENIPEFATVEEINQGEGELKSINPITLKESKYIRGEFGPEPPEDPTVIWFKTQD